MGLPPLGRRALAKQRFQCIWALTRQVPLDLDIEAIAKESGSSPDQDRFSLIDATFRTTYVRARRARERRGMATVLKKHRGKCTSG